MELELIKEEDKKLKQGTDEADDSEEMIDLYEEMYG